MDTPESPEPVATGDRRDEVRFERDPNQIVRARFTAPAKAVAAHDVTPSAPHEPPAIPVDAVEAPKTPSAWDARPADD